MLKLKQTIQRANNAVFIYSQPSYTAASFHYKLQRPSPSSLKLSRTASIFSQCYSKRNLVLFEAMQTKVKAAPNPSTRIVEESLQKQEPVQSEDYRTASEIQISIDLLKENIKEKTYAGQTLANAVSEQVSPDTFTKLQRYEIFLTKMKQLYNNEKRHKSKQNMKLEQMRQASTYSQTPLKDILRTYNELSNRGFDPESLGICLNQVNKAILARGTEPRVMHDYSLYDLDQSWRMQKICDDLKLIIKEDNKDFYTGGLQLTPHHFAKIANELGELGYKHSELILAQLQKVVHQLQVQKIQDRTVIDGNIEVSLEQQTFGSFKNFLPRHYIFQGFQSNSEFQEYVKILMEWESEKDKSYLQKLKKSNKFSKNEEVQILQNQMGNLIEAAINVKDSQKDIVASIESLRQQFFKLQQATNKHQFLLDNPYIKYDMLELQEQLVKAGYINAEESNHIDQILNNESMNQKMERASQVFYDYVLNYQPEFLSPQFEQLYQAATETQSSVSPQKDHQQIESTDHNILNLKYLSQILVGISKQALSFRRDVIRKDYLNEFYEQYLMPLERNNDTHELKHLKYDYVLMEREYLRSWVIFKQKLNKIGPQLINKAKDAIESKNRDQAVPLLYAISAFNECRIDQNWIRGQMLKRCYGELRNEIKLTMTEVIDGLMGLARSPNQTDQSIQKVAECLVSRINLSPNLSFQDQLNLLWSLCVLQQYNNSAVKDLLEAIDELPFERVGHELSYENYFKLVDIYNALEVEGPKDLRFKNEDLIMAVKGKKVQELGYQESKLYDPFKDKVLAGLAKGLAAASIEHTFLVENQLFNNTKQEVENLYPEKYPYKPDIVMGYQGQKIGVFVLSEKHSLIQTNSKDGAISFRMRLIENAHKDDEDKIKCVFIPVTKVVSYDLENFKLYFNQNFNLMHELNSQLGKSTERGQMEKVSNAFNNLTKIATQIIREVKVQENQSMNEVEIVKMSELLEQIQKLYHLKQSAELKSDEIQRENAVNEVKLALLRLSLIYENLPKSCQSLITKILKNNPKEEIQSNDFKGILLNIKDSLSGLSKKNKEKQEKEEEKDSELSSTWIGTRLEVELPVSQNENIKKSIVPEIINQRFMWVDDYFHYDDWKVKQQATFDNFSLLVIPHNKDAPKFFFDRENHHRRIPQGIFPSPNKKRTLMLPSANLTAQQLVKQSGNDEFIMFEKDPYKMMVVKELQKSEKLEPISKEVSLITNLQNVKQSLKSDYSDVEILRIILLNLTFTDQLIEEHLSNLEGVNKEQKDTNKEEQERYLQRDPQYYRQFQSQQYFSKDREDPFTDFYIREAAKKQKILDLALKDKQFQKEDDHLQSDKAVQRGKERTHNTENLIENMLLQNEMENEDLTSLSHALRTNIKINYDLKSLMKSEFIYDVDPELTDQSLSDQQYLERQRRRAESKLIKMKIIYKVYSELAPLTNNEKKYLKEWIKDMKSNSERNLLNLRDSLLPNKTTNLTFFDLDAQTYYALNSLNNVSFDRDLHGSYSVNDLVLELSNFLDEEVIDKVQMEIFSERVSEEWDLSKDFKLVETRNKEISIVLNELEEVYYRMSGMFDDKDFENMRKMFSVKRNSDYFDKQYFENDMKSLKEFMCDSNFYDNRIKMLENWVLRKEEEWKTRVVLPTANLKRSDKELHQQLEKDWKKAREKLVSKLLTHDEYGTPISKSYQEMTSKELGTIAQNLSIRLYMFNYEYPQFVAEIVKGVLEHPNLRNSDKMMLENYCKMFELDWRGDTAYLNRQEFMSYRPIYLKGDNFKSYMNMELEDIRNMIKSSCSPYLEDVTLKMKELSQ